VILFLAMAAGRRRVPVALGFSVHTGWAALVAVSGPVASPAVVDRSRLEMIPGTDPARPRFVFHAAQELPLAEARRLVERSAALARTQARAALQAALDALATGDHRVVGGAVIGGNRPLTATLETILESHALVHSAEGALFREAIADALRAAGLPVTEVPAKELQPRAARALGLSSAKVAELMARLGKQAGRPWAKDQRDACLAALLNLA
jgi:hypothetical protein